MFLLLLLFIFSGCGINESFPFIPKDDFSEVELHPTYDYKDKIIDKFDKGLPLTEFVTVEFDRYVSNHLLCDFQTKVYPQKKQPDWGYIPAVCVHTKTCNNTFFELGEWSNKTCTQYSNTEKKGHPDYLCCPIQSTTDYQYFPIINNPIPEDRYLFEFLEVPTNFKMYEASPYTALSQRNAGAVKDNNIIESVVDPDFKSKMQSALVCGFRLDEVIQHENESKSHADVYSIIPFFCTPPQFCRANKNDADITKPHSTWTYFCSNNVKYDPREVGRTVCCHADDIIAHFFHGQPPSKLHLPQLPNYLQYAPGLRSAYKCEEYGKYVCEGKLKPCEAQGAPFLAVLGFVAPKFMKFHCGGTLISVRYILSSSSCKQYYGFTTNVVLLGESTTSDTTGSVDSYEKTYVVADIISYQKYGFYSQPDDIPPSEADRVDLALYKTDRDVKLSSNVRPACLYHSLVTPWPSLLAFSGYGPDVNDAYRTEKLKRLEMFKLPRGNCSAETNYDEYEDPYYGRYGVNKDYMICYHNDKSTHAPCRYDRGGPLRYTLTEPFCSVLLMGVLSSNREDCSRLHPHVFINVTMFIKEIEDVVWGQYTFLDVFNKDLVRAPCTTSDNLMFFNK